MADILFITPNFSGSVIDEPVGTLLLATILKRNGLDAEIIPFSRFGDADQLDAFLDTATQQIVASGAKIVSFYTRCDCYHIMIKMAQQIKCKTSAFVVFGGPQADISAAQTIRSISWVDFVCCGEGEGTVYPFFRSLLQGQPDLSVAGLVYREAGDAVVNPRPAMIQDLDTLPEVDYTIVGMDQEFSIQLPFPIDVGRGCPFGCVYCSTKSFWGRKYRLKSPERILDEIKHLHQRFHITTFAFEHDMFTMNRKQVTETCRLLKTLDFPIRWKCSARIDCIDKELIDTMVDAGMYSLYLGIETGSARMQKLINKNLDLNTVMPMLEYLNTKGIKVITSFIYGLPEETEEDLSQTIQLMLQIAMLKQVDVHYHLCTFLPGTELSNKYADQLVPTDHFSNITGTVALAQCMDLVNQHPKLFSHFFEYKTALRSKLEHFPVFVSVFAAMPAVYSYLSEKYPHDRLIQMYDDFVQANRQTLEQQKEQHPAIQARAIIANDHFAEKFSGDPLYDIIRDSYLLVTRRNALLHQEASFANEILCFSPEDMDNGLRLQDYTRRLAIVQLQITKDNKIQITTKCRG